MDNNEIIGKINCLLDRTRFGHVIWSEHEYGIYINKTNDVAIGVCGIQFGIKDGINCEYSNIIDTFPDLCNRLYKAAEKSAIYNKKTYGDLYKVIR